MQENGQVETLMRKSASLQKLKAARVVTGYGVSPEGETLIQDLLVAFRPRKDDIPEIIYTIRLRTVKSRYDADKEVLSQIFNGWELRPPGR